MLLVIIAALIAALLVEHQRADRVAAAYAMSKIARLWDDPTVRNLRSEAKKPSNSAKAGAVLDKR